MIGPAPRGSSATRLRRLAAAAAATAALAAAATGSAAAAVPDGFWGVVPINPLNKSEYEKMGKGGADTLRNLTLWPSIEPKRDEYNWGGLDLLVASSAENGIEVLPFLYGTPAWAGVNCRGLPPELCQRVPPLGKASQAWSDFLRDMVARYGTQGSFWTDQTDQYDPPYVPITEWQIWNEPSSFTYWQPKPKPKGYAKLVRISHRAITDADPSAEIVLAGVFPSPEGGDQYNFTRYLDALYSSKGIGKAFDSAAFHPYAATIGRLRNQIKAIRRELRQAGFGNKRLWVSEIGWGSDPPQPDRPLIKGPDGQRDLLEQSFKLLESRRNAWKLAGVLWYSWRDPGVGYENCPFCSSSGLFKENGDPKPSWHAFVRATGGSEESGPDDPLPPEEPPPPVLP